MAVGSRDLISQAEGILMERSKVTGDEAFGLLARVSMQTNRELLDAATELAEAGTMPGTGRWSGR